MCDYYNTKILANLLGCRNNNTFQLEYDNHIKSELIIWIDNIPHPLLLSYPNQRGGVAYNITTKSETMPIQVETLIGNDELTDRKYSIIFFHHKQKKYMSDLPFLKYCMMIKIFQKDKFAEISDLNPCIDSKYGRIMIRAAIFYCQINKDKLGIDYIQLGDNAIYRCAKDKFYPIKISLSRQLLGQYPYYWRFGFRPNSKIVNNIKFNLLKIANIKTKDMLSQYYQQSLLDHLQLKGGLNLDLKSYLIANESQSLSASLKYISDNYCKYYSGIYDTLYAIIGLLPISGGGLDDVWILYL